MVNTRDVQELAQKLNDWAEERLPNEQRYLLKCLLSRGAYTEKRVDEHHVEGTTVHLGASNIRQAVIDALTPVIKDLPNPPIEGWPRFSSWPRYDGWARDGYWALGMGVPPKDLMRPGGPETPSV